MVRLLSANRKATKAQTTVTTKSITEPLSRWATAAGAAPIN